MFRDFPEYNYYKETVDHYLDFIKKEAVSIGDKGYDKYKDEKISAIPVPKNIVLTPAGLRVLSNHYKNKYRIEIEVLSVSKWSPAAKILTENIKKFRSIISSEAKSTPTLFRRGIVLHDSNVGSAGHSDAVLYEKNGDHEKIYFFGIFDYSKFKKYADASKKNLSVENPLGWDLLQEIQSKLPELEIWACGDSGEQYDMSSCTIIAISKLKDCLKMDGSLFDTIRKRGKLLDQVCGVQFSYLPEELLKACQIESRIQENKSNPKHIIHKHRVKDFNGKLTGKTVDVSLEDFRKDYAVVTEGNIGRPFSTYSLNKGERYKEIIYKSWLEERQEEVESILEMLAQTKVDFDRAKSFDKDASKSSGNDFLNILREVNPDKYESRDKIQNICSAIEIVQRPPENFVVNDKIVQNALACEQLLVMLINDQTQPSIKRNFENYIKDDCVDRGAKEYKIAKKIFEQAVQITSKESFDSLNCDSAAILSSIEKLSLSTGSHVLKSEKEEKNSPSEKPVILNKQTCIPPFFKQSKKGKNKSKIISNLNANAGEFVPRAFSS